jgi:hypothetical protein
MERNTELHSYQRLLWLAIVYAAVIGMMLG